MKSDKPTFEIKYLSESMDPVKGFAASPRVLPDATYDESKEQFDIILGTLYLARRSRTRLSHICLRDFHRSARRSYYPTNGKEWLSSSWVRATAECTGTSELNSSAMQ